jgi:hypothetical protein
VVIGDGSAQTDDAARTSERRIEGLSVASMSIGSLLTASQSQNMRQQIALQRGRGLISG